ncbi:hypothetical protein STEG23_023260 [Scotinomys teguina]
MTVTPLGRDQDCSLKNREPDVPAPWFLDPGGWSKSAAVGLYFIFPGLCTLSLIGQRAPMVMLSLADPSKKDSGSKGLTERLSWAKVTSVSVCPFIPTKNQREKRTIARTVVLQESIGKRQFGEVWYWPEGNELALHKKGWVGTVAAAIEHKCSKKSGKTPDCNLEEVTDVCGVRKGMDESSHSSK